MFGIYSIYIISGAAGLIIGIIIILCGFATDRKALKLAGTVVAVCCLQTIIISFLMLYLNSLITT